MNCPFWRFLAEMDGWSSGLVPFSSVCVVVQAIGVLGPRCREAAFVKSMLSNCGVSARSSSRKPLSESDAASPSVARLAAARAVSSPASPRLRTAMSAQRRVTSKTRRSARISGHGRFSCSRSSKDAAPG